MTIYDIAKEAGVSASTVSRVVNNKPGIREKTREKVMAVVEKYNFAPDETARGLVRQATKTIGLLIADVRIANYMMGVHYVIKEIAKLGYCCIVIDTGLKNEDRAEHVKILSQRRVEGAILFGAGYQCDEVREAIGLYMKDIPVVIVNGCIDMPNVYSVFTDERKGAEICFDYAFAKGYRYPAYIGCSSVASNDNKLAGLADSIAKHCPDMQVPIYISDSPFDCGYRETHQVLTDHPATDVIIYSSDYFAMAGLRMLQEMGVNVPKKLGIVTGEESTYSTITHPYMTSLDAKVEYVCEAACKMMIDILLGRTVEKNTRIIPKMNERETTENRK